ncbi:sodium:solute symporter family protein [Pseudomonas chlororaphis]|uniref:Sodium:solute symporter family protein n=1 Tax=Pseudomonas chlororaphis TaxID=587753 RepID=A0AB34C3M3_9PSED|nr:sodium:solute symporter family protein [Pseudomonas chlororaphis]KAA5841273.1 sodium:solute symporter family protein [Pseudomonas chlororaphis]
MQMLIGYGGVLIFFLIIIYALEKSHKTDGSGSFSEYATGGRSFGSFYSTMAFVNTWLPGTIFISFAGFAASSGIIGFYYVPYSLLAVVLMFLLAKPVHMWGKAFDLRTQADLLGLRYNSKTVRVVAAAIGIIASFPWIVLGMQSLTLVFTHLSFGAVSATTAVFIGIGLIVARQIWTIRFGARGVIVSDMIQGIAAYLIGTLIALGLLVWLTTNGHGFGQSNSSMFTIPGPGSELGPLYLFSLIVTGALGGWCWPDIFVRLFASRSTRTIQKSAVQVAPILLIFGTSITLLALSASTLPGVQESPDAVWFIAAEVGGVLVVTLAGICVVAATMGNVGANLQALGAQTANDIVGVLQERRIENHRIGQLTVAILTILAAVFAVSTTKSSHLITLAMTSYQGIVQLAPTIFLGIFWKRGTAAAAVCSMISGFVCAGVLQWYFPTSLPQLGGLTSGVVALAVNFAVYVTITLLFPATAAERQRVNELYLFIDSPQTKSTAKSSLAIS